MPSPRKPVVPRAYVPAATAQRALPAGAKKTPVVPPVYRPQPTRAAAQPKRGATGPPVPAAYRPAARPGVVGAIQRDVDSAAQELYLGGHKSTPKLKPAFLKKHAVTKENLEAIETKLQELRTAAAAKPKKEADDITAEYNVAFACVLQAIVYIKGSAWGKSSPKDLHTLIWTDKTKAAYKQYDDDSVIPLLLAAVGMSAVEIPDGTTVSTLPAALESESATKFFVSVKGSVEDHTLILDGEAWKEYKQTGGGSGFRDARTDESAAVKSVYR